MTALGPGSLKIGTAGSETDYSCLVTGLELTVAASTTDSVFKLCGTEVPGVTTLDGTLNGTLDQDLSDPDGLFKFASVNAATIQSFLFEPSTEAGLEASGQVLILPLSFGSTDAYGEEMTSDVTWQTVGDITYTPSTGAAWVQKMGPRPAVLPDAVPATGATAGTPGVFTPAGSTAPADVAGLAGLTASPATAWTTGQYVQTATAGTAGQGHWNGTAWVAGATP